jgi:hypothetical protein
MAQKDVSRFFALTATILSLAVPALAQQTPYAHITALQTGSLGGAPSLGRLPGRIDADDTLAVDLDTPFVNSAEPSNPAILHPPPPTPCKVTSGGYALDPKDSGVKLNESVLLSAYLAGRKVSLHLSGCVFDKPRIVSVSMSTSNN